MENVRAVVEGVFGVLKRNEGGWADWLTRKVGSFLATAENFIGLVANALAGKGDFVVAVAAKVQVPVPAAPPASPTADEVAAQLDQQVLAGAVAEAIKAQQAAQIEAAVEQATADLRTKLDGAIAQLENRIAAGPTVDVDVGDDDEDSRGGEAARTGKGLPD